VLNCDEVVFLLDVDNTLFDNDRFKSDLAARLLQDFGPKDSEAYWAHYDALRNEVGYVDYLAALQRLRADIDETPKLLGMSSFILDYAFPGNLYSDALASIAHLRGLGTPVIFSDGDIVFQPRKIQRSGIWDAVAGRVIVAVHKQAALSAMQHRFPARHYVMVDDKPQILAAMKAVLGDRLTTVFVKQGHYAMESVMATISPAPDRTIDRIGELRSLDLQWLFSDAPAHITASAAEATTRA
jgi:FMN phosphatase YigB (HAD superfamily)